MTNSTSVVVLRRSASLNFVTDACAALAEEVNRVRAARPADGQLAEVYAELVIA
ncbi:hypothetical protein [Nocardia sp. NPDC052566]|uniref:hypothetical protein n=1 Tax=Nocardia sp. NPDC052566 TaxID=3364330 RepID=UPI0037C86BF8